MPSARRRRPVLTFLRRLRSFLWQRRMRKVPSKAQLRPAGPLTPKRIRQLVRERDHHMPPGYPADDFERHVRESNREQYRAHLEQAADGNYGEVWEPVPFRPKRLKRYPALFEAAGRALHERRTVSIETNAGRPLVFRIIEFRDGTACLEHGLRAIASGHSRLEETRDNPVDLAREIEFGFYGARVRPIAGQEF